MEKQKYSTLEPGPNSISIPQLRKKFKGQVIAPEDPEYDQARTLFYGGFDSRPAVIVRPADETEVSQVILFARENGLELAVRSGGHSVAGYSSSDGGLVLDLYNLRALEINAEKSTAWAQAGLTTGEYTARADAYDLATGFGDTGSVGIGGLTLGGGIGYLVRKHGLAIDSLLAARLVTADGQLVQADAETHPDLFWAIRGGGGNFGVATRFQFRLHKLGPIIGGILILPATPEVITSFIASAESAPDELSTIANIMPAPPLPFVPVEYQGKMVMMVSLVYAGPTKDGDRVMTPFRSIAKPIVDMVQPMRYPKIFPPEPAGYHPVAKSMTMFVESINLPEAKLIVNHLQASNAPLRAAQLRVLGGAMARVSNEATAFAHRERRIMVNIAAIYNRPEEASMHAAWVTDFAASLHRSDGAYVNFLGNEGQARVRETYPGYTWERLRAIKRRYDPTNLFHLNQNIPPAD